MVIWNSIKGFSMRILNYSVVFTFFSGWYLFNFVGGSCRDEKWMEINSLTCYSYWYTNEWIWMNVAQGYTLIHPCNIIRLMKLWGEWRALIRFHKYLDEFFSYLCRSVSTMIKQRFQQNLFYVIKQPKGIPIFVTCSTWAKRYQS